MRDIRIHTFPSVSYLNHEICIRTFSYYFEFLFVHKGKIHGHFVKVEPSFLNRVLYLIGKNELPYSKEQVEGSKQIILQMASQVIDELCK